MTSCETSRRGALAALVLAAFPLAAQAQDYAPSSIKVDGSVGSVDRGLARFLAPVGGIYGITDELGDYSHDGATLFHSFEIFHVGVGETAEFSAALGDPQQILARVTGSDKSIIKGTLRNSVSGSDLFLMNPRGIDLLHGARLDMQGSFHATTADLLRFSDGGMTFEADAAAPLPLFVTGPPSAFGFTSAAPAGVKVVGWVEPQERPPFLDEQRPYGVPAGETLSFVGGDIDISGVSAGFDTIYVPGGTVQIAAAGGVGDLPVVLESFDAVNSEIPLGDIALSKYASLNVSGDSDVEDRQAPGRRAGAIVIRGGRFEMGESSQLLATNWADAVEGTETTGRIDLGVKGMVDVSGSTISLGSNFGGPGSHLEARAGGLELTEGAKIETFTRTGQGGDLFIEAEADIQITSGAYIQSLATRSGAGGDVDIRAGGTVGLSGGAVIKSEVVARRSGAGGQVDIWAGDAVDVSGGAYILSKAASNSSGAGGHIDISTGGTVGVSELAKIQSESAGSGAGGNVEITAETLEVRSGGQVANFKASAGRGGSIDIGVQTLRVSGTPGSPELSDDSRIYTLVTPSGSGLEPGGDLVVDAANIELLEGGQLFASTEGAADAGDVFVEAEGMVRISGRGVSDLEGSSGEILHSGITSRAREFATGSGGRIRVISRLLEVLDGGEISASTLGAGAGGDLSIHVSERIVARGAPDADTTISVASVGNNFEAAIGDAGRMTIVAAEMEISDGVSVTASRAGAVTAGDDPRAGEIEIRVGKLRISGADTGIFSQAAGGTPLEEERSGGSIVVVTQGDFELENGGLVSAKSSGSNGDAGRIEITAGRSLLSTGGSVTTQAAGLDGSGGGQITLVATERMEFVDSEVKTSVSSGEGNGGDISLKGPASDGSPIVPVGVVLLNDSDVEASAGAGSGGNISIVASGYLQSGDSVVDASSEKSIDGEISIRAPANDITTEVAALPVELLDTAALVASACSSTQGADASFQVQRRTRPALPPDVVTGLDVMRLSNPCANRENLQ